MHLLFHKPIKVVALVKPYKKTKRNENVMSPKFPTDVLFTAKQQLPILRIVHIYIYIYIDVKRVLEAANLTMA